MHTRSRARSALWECPSRHANVSNGDRREVIELTKGAYYQVPVLSHDAEVVFESSPSSIDVARYVDRSSLAGGCSLRHWEGLQRIVIPYIEDNVESVTFKLVDPHYLRDIEDPIERAMVRRHKERKFGPGCEERWEQERRFADRSRAAALPVRPDPGAQAISLSAIRRSSAISRSLESSEISRIANTTRSRPH